MPGSLMDDSTDKSTNDWEVMPSTEFNSVRDTWQTINDRSGALPMLDAEFYRLLLQYFGDARTMLCIESFEGSARSAGLLTSHKPGIVETFQPSQAPLGAWVCDGRTIRTNSLHALTKKLSSFHILLGLTQLDPQKIDRPDDAARLRVRDYIETARLDTVGDFSEYWNARSKNLRQNLRKQRHRLEKERVETRLDVVTNECDVREAVNNFALLECSGWKSQLGTALHPDNVQGAFYRELLEHYAAHGEARIYNYYLNSDLAASDLCLFRNGTTYILKTTYDEKLARFSPAMLMREEQLKMMFACENEIAIEFYGRAMDWHRRLTSDVRTLFHVNFYRWSWLAGPAFRFK